MIKKFILLIFVGHCITGCAAMSNIPQGAIGNPITQILGAELPRKGAIDTQKWFEYGAAIVGGLSGDLVESIFHP